MNKFTLLSSSLLLTFGLISCGGDDDGTVTPPPVVFQNSVPEFYDSSEVSVYGADAPEQQVIADQSTGLDHPNDLSFHSFDDRKNELWVLCPGAETIGGHTVTYFDALTDPTNYDRRRDGNAFHFMALATALDFGENGNFATSQGILDANRRGINYTGPTMWSSDMSIYAKVGSNPTQQVNGSHLDMVHQSPMGMGIAHEKDNVYWTFDGFHNDVVRYDFVQPHYPGGEDHSDAIVSRYMGFGDEKLKMSTNTTIPSHLYMDKETGWLYICDTGNKRVLKMNTASGNEANGFTVGRMHGEPMADYQEWENFEYTVIAESGLEEPSGIVVVENRVFVSDFSTGKIHCYDKILQQELGVFDTGNPGVTGLEIGPEGRLWFTNALTNQVIKLEPIPVDEV